MFFPIFDVLQNLAPRSLENPCDARKPHIIICYSDQLHTTLVYTPVSDTYLPLQLLPTQCILHPTVYIADVYIVQYTLHCTGTHYTVHIVHRAAKKMVSVVSRIPDKSLVVTQMTQRIMKKLVRQRSYWRHSGEYVQRRACFVNIRSSLHEKVVFSVCACLCIIFIMLNSTSGLDDWYHFRFNTSCGVGVTVRGHKKKIR